MKKLVASLAAFALVAFTGVAVADLSVKDSAAATQVMFDFICFTTKHCSAHVPVNSAGTEIGTAGTPIQVSVANTGANATAVKVDGSAVTQPISVASIPTHAVTQSGTWTVQPGNTANTVAWLVTGTGGTFPATQSGTWNLTNISGTVSLPTGAATSANQTTELASLATIATNSALPLPTQAITVPVGGVGLIDSNSNTVLNDPCATAAKVYTPVNVVTATNVVIAGVSAKKKYICGIFLYPAGTTNIAVYQATTSTSCATAQTDIFGGHTTGTGFVATAQAGFVVGNGASSMAATTTNQTDICITTSAAVQVSGVVVTVDR